MLMVFVFFRHYFINNFSEMNLTTPNNTDVFTNIILFSSATASPSDIHNGTSLEGNLDRVWLYQHYSPVGRHLAFIWSLFTAVLSIFGNITVFVGSVKYNALPVDRVSISLIRNLAVADVTSGICIVINVAYITTGSNVYGEVLCYIFTRFFYFLQGVGTVFISTLNVNKLHCLLFPLRARSRTFRQGHVVCSIIWISTSLLSVVPVVFEMVDKTTIEFLPGGNQCTKMSSDNSRVVYIFSTIAAVLLVLVPILTILITTIWLACLVKRVTGAIQRQGVLTLLLVSLVFISSYAPYFCFIIMRDSLPTELTHTIWFATFFRTTTLAVYASSAANPIIYSLSIRSFGTFVKSSFKCGSLRIVPQIRFRLGLAVYRVTRVIGWTSG